MTSDKVHQLDQVNTTKWDNNSQWYMYNQWDIQDSQWDIQDSQCNQECTHSNQCNQECTCSNQATLNINNNIDNH